MKPGMILVLFILLVIVTSIFNKSINGRNPQDGNLSAQGRTVGFNFYNRTGGIFQYTVRLRSIYGSLEEPEPPLGELTRAGEDKNYQVVLNWLSEGQARLYYDIIAPNTGLVIGNMLLVFSYIWASTNPGPSVYSELAVEAPASYVLYLDTGGTYATLKVRD
ncbi:hypothetical protein SAMN05444162_1866 [Paenibacillaceae bacterium GAS479]|nr:hypothetical protein SAMN05444162_1866 [Paenibacillaceae bacterium GAS479]